MNWDPYHELGVTKGASERDIKAAARRHASAYHPDAGGAREAFERGRRARKLLLDPEKRKAFDETGHLDGDPVDNTRQAALGVVQNHMALALQRYLENPLNQDPRYWDLVAALRGSILDEIDTAHKSITEAKRRLAFLVDCKDRFMRKQPVDGDDPIATGFDINIERMRGEVERFTASVTMRLVALEILKDYSFRKEVAS